MRVIICGVRGSTPSPGPGTVRYGGETSCLAVGDGGPGRAPSLVLDGGTGLRRLARMLDGHTFRGSVVLTHLHWDHTHGLPFFGAGTRPEAAVDVLLPEQGIPRGSCSAGPCPPRLLHSLKGRPGGRPPAGCRLAPAAGGRAVPPRARYFHSQSRQV